MVIPEKRLIGSKRSLDREHGRESGQVGKSERAGWNA
jgi:hypothetical protein